MNERRLNEQERLSFKKKEGGRSVDTKMVVTRQLKHGESERRLSASPQAWLGEKGQGGTMKGRGKETQGKKLDGLNTDKGPKATATR